MRSLGVDVRLGTTVASIEDSPERGVVIATLNDGSRMEAGLMVGADGIRSNIRTMLFGVLEPEDTGFGVWRSIHRRPPELREKIMMMGVGKRLGIMPISQDQLYVYATSNEPGRPRYDPARFHLTMREKFAEFAGPATPLLNDIRDPSQVFYTAVEEIRLPLPWSKGRVLLIGDAAHASTPFMGQGGTMAIEDSNVLVSMLAEGQDVAQVLLEFGARRQPKCQFVQDVSRRVGEAGGMESANTCVSRNARMREQAQADVDNFYRRLYEFDLIAT
jgi:2-polyprenyl-6-methoxyphenol hydroxylase-like FAD-dependent oxidoreductase